MACRSGCSDIQGLLVFEKVGVDGVGVVVIEDKDVLIPALREDQESSCFVRLLFSDLGVDVDDGSENVVEALFLLGVEVVEGILMRVSGTKIILLLIEVAFHHEGGLWKMFGC